MHVHLLRPRSLRFSSLSDSWSSLQRHHRLQNPRPALRSLSLSNSPALRPAKMASNLSQSWVEVPETDMSAEASATKSSLPPNKSPENGENGQRGLSSSSRSSCKLPSYIPRSASITRGANEQVRDVITRRLAEKRHAEGKPHANLSVEEPPIKSSLPPNKSPENEKAVQTPVQSASSIAVDKRATTKLRIENYRATPSYQRYMKEQAQQEVARRLEDGRQTDEGAHRAKLNLMLQTRRYQALCFLTVHFITALQALTGLQLHPLVEYLCRVPHEYWVADIFEPPTRPGARKRAVIYVSYSTRRRPSFSIMVESLFSDYKEEQAKKSFRSRAYDYLCSLVQRSPVPQNLSLFGNLRVFDELQSPLVRFLIATTQVTSISVMPVIRHVLEVPLKTLALELCELCVYTGKVLHIIPRTRRELLEAIPKSLENMQKIVRAQFGWEFSNILLLHYAYKKALQEQTGST